MTGAVPPGIRARPTSCSGCDTDVRTGGNDGRYHHRTAAGAAVVGALAGLGRTILTSPANPSAGQIAPSDSKQKGHPEVAQICADAGEQLREDQ